MKVLSIGSDRNIFKEGSAVRARMLEYGRLFEELHIIVFVNRFKINDLGFKVKKVQISKNIWVYPTHSLSRWFYVFDAIRIGKSIIEKARNDFVVSGQDPFECGLVALKIKQRDKEKTSDLFTIFLSRSETLSSLALFFSFVN